MFDVLLVAPDVEIVPHRDEELLLDPLADLLWRHVGLVTGDARLPDRVEHVRVPVIDWRAGEDQPMVRLAGEHADGTAEPEHVAVNPQRHLVGVVAIGSRPARQEAPFLVDDVPLQQFRRHRRAVHVLEVGAVGSVLGHDLRVYRFALGLLGELRVGPVVGLRVGLVLRERREDVGHLPLGFLAVGVIPREHAVVLLLDRVHPERQTAIGAIRLIRDVPVGAVRAPPPPVEWALHAIADHRAAVPEVRTQVLAVRLHQVQFTGLVAVRDEVVTEVVQRAHLASGELGRPADHEPAGDLPGEWNLHDDVTLLRYGATVSITVARGRAAPTRLGGVLPGNARMLADTGHLPPPAG